MHMIIIKLLRKYDIAQNSFGLVVFFAALVASIFVSYLSFVFIEQKSAQLCRTLLQKLKASRLGRQRSESTATNCELGRDRKSTRLNSSHVAISYAVFCLKKKK